MPEIDADLTETIKKERRRKIVNCIPSEDLRWLFRATIGENYIGEINNLRTLCVEDWSEFETSIFQWLNKAKD